MVSNPAFAVDGLDKEITIGHVAGVEGPSIYVNDYRVAGPKPWGGGHVVHEWKTTLRDVLVAVLGEPDIGDAELQRLAREDALEFHRERRRRLTPALLDRLAAFATPPVPAPVGIEEER